MCQMPTFIDESGSFGWKDDSSKHFTLTAVWFETAARAIAGEEVIARIRTKLGLSAAAEFHFAETSHPQRMAFLEAVSTCEFLWITCTLSKWHKNKWLDGRMWRKRPYFYEKVIRPVVNILKDYLLIAECCKGKPLCEPVTYDENDDQIYKEILRNEFYRPKASIGRSLVRKVRPRTSENDSLVQLADMICGSYVHSFQSSEEYMTILQPKVIKHIFIP